MTHPLENRLLAAARSARVRRAGAATLAAAVLGLAACSSEPPEGPRQWRLSVATAEGSSMHDVAQRFAERVARELPQFKMTIYPGAQLANGDAKTELGMVRQGVIEVGVVSTSMLALYADPRFDALALPWLFPDPETPRRVMRDASRFGDQLTGWLGDKLMIPLAWGAAGFRQLATREKAVRTPEDLAGLDLRVPGTRLATDLYAILGANAVALPDAEVAAALTSGAVDGLEASLEELVAAPADTPLRHVTLWDVAYDSFAVLVSVPAWDKLSRREQSIVIEQARQATSDHQDRVAARRGEQLAALTGRGFETVTLTPEELDAFRLRVRPIYDRYRPRIGAKIVDALVSEVGAVAQQLGTAYPALAPGALPAPAPLPGAAGAPSASTPPAAAAPVGEAPAAADAGAPPPPAPSKVRVLHE